MSKQAKKRIAQLLGSELEVQVSALNDEDSERLASILAKPNVRCHVNRAQAPFGATLQTNYGSVLLDSSLKTITSIYVNGQKFGVTRNGLDAVDAATGTEDEIKSVLGEQEGRQRRGRKVRSRADNKETPFAAVQDAAFKDLSRSGITYDSLFQDLGGLMAGRNVEISDIADELFANKVDEPDIPHFLVYESQYKNDIVSQVYGLNLGPVDSDYNFKTQKQDDTFAGRLLKRLNVPEAQYDAKAGVMDINGRKITNLPEVDANGVFHNGDTAYLPYYIGYFVEGTGSRVSRLRVQDPVASALDALDLQFSMTQGDVKFKTILDVTRNLPDFDNHPYGAEILDTLKHKVVLSKDYANTNSLLAEYAGKTDNLGAVATTILDDDARGILDPLGTSNGRNMGKILFLADGVKIGDDGSLTKSDQEFSKVGKILNNYNINRDNFNRNQMSFNAFLTSVDVKEVNVAYAEFALWNAEDAVVMTKHGADNAFNTKKLTGDKVMDMHGNKGTISLIVDPDMPEDDAKDQHLAEAVQFAKLNPNVDMVVSPLSIASRLNMGVAHEGLSGQKSDLHLPDGSVVKNGVTKMLYMSLPQTAEHKSKNYEVEGTGRKYSSLLHYALASKIGPELYDKAFIDENVRQEHIDHIAHTFNRLGVSFNDDNKLLTDGNINLFVDAPVEIDHKELSMLTPSVIRTRLMSKMENGQININLGDMSVTNPFTDQPIVDSFGEHVLPISLDNNGSIPYRYAGVFEAISLGNKNKLNDAFEHAIAIDYRALTRKDNLMKNIDTMVFRDEAHTDVITPDPRLGLNETRANMDSDYVIAHRDPAIHASSVVVLKNVGGGAPNVMPINPLMAVQQDADYDGDTEGVKGVKDLPLTAAEKQQLIDHASVTEQVNNYGEPFLSLDGHFRAAMLANKDAALEDGSLDFKDNKSNEQLVENVDNAMRRIVDSPKSYGAYALDFSNEATVLQGLAKLADDDIKGTREKIEAKFNNGYTDKENRDVLKALIAKSEWTGLAGATTNNMIANFTDEDFDPKIVRPGMATTASMTAYVLHELKTDADKLPVVDKNIKDMKSIMAGSDSIEVSRERLKEITSGLIPVGTIDDFVDNVAAKQKELGYGDKAFGYGVINNTETTTTKLAYEPTKKLSNALREMGNEFEQSADSPAR